MNVEDLIFLSRIVGESVLEFLGSRMLLDEKEFGGDMARLIDKKAESSLMFFLNTLKKNVSVLTEGLGFLELGDEGVLVVDPVDGSLNADKGLPLFAVSMAYFEDLTFESLRIGVIYEPTRKVRYYAERGNGAYMRKSDGTEKQLRPPKRPSLEVVYFSLSSDKLDLVKKLLNVGIRVRELGSVALGLAYTAAGMIDAFVDLRGFVRLMDIAAGYLILKEAGYGLELVEIERFPYPKYSLLAAPREMLKALKVYLGSEGSRSMFLRGRPARGGPSIRQ